MNSATQKTEGDKNFKNDITFTSSVRDMSTGLQYMNARYYDPATGRFISQDTFRATPTTLGHSTSTAIAGIIQPIWWIRRGISLLQLLSLVRQLDVQLVLD